MSNSIDRFIVTFGRLMVRWRYAVCAAALIMTGLAAGGLQRLAFETDYRVFFSKDNPELRAFDALQNIYAKNENVLFVLAPRDGDAFTPRALDAAEWLTEESWQLPYAVRVDSVTNFQHISADGDTLTVEALVSDAAAMSPEAAQRAKAIALNEPLLRKLLVSETGDVVGINVLFEMPPTNRFLEVPKVVKVVHRLEERFRERYPDVDLHTTGMIVMDYAFSEAGIHDIKTLMPLMYLGIFLMMWWLLRSVTATVFTMTIVTISSVSALGMAGWLGIHLTPPSAQASTIIMTLAVADSVHLLLTAMELMREGRTRREAIVESLRINITPVFLTSLDTCIGFLAMNFSDAPPFRDLGNITAIGVLVAFVCSVALLPAMVALIPMRAAAERTVEQALIRRLSEFVIRRRRRILAWGAVTVLLMGYGITRNQLNDQFVEYFDESIPFRVDTDFMKERMSGFYQLEYSIGAKETGGICDPEYLRTLDAFKRWLQQHPHVEHVWSFSDVMLRINKSMHGDDLAWYRLPEDRNLAAQYLLLYELSLPYGQDLNNMINVDKSSTRMIVTLHEATTREILQVAEESEQWLADHAPPWMFAKASGASVMFAHISERNLNSMLGGTLLAVLLIAGVLMVALRSVVFGVISLIPNIVPMILGFGVWGLFVGQVGLSLSVVVGMVLGIVVDDTIHFMAKYLRGRREKGMDSEAAVRYGFSTVGTAMIVTSLILIVGFGILSCSAFQLNSAMGRLTTITIAIAMVADCLLLPPLLIAVDRRWGVGVLFRRRTTARPAAR